MKKQISIVVAEDDEGHALLIKRNLARFGVVNPILHFRDGEEILDFFQNKNSDYHKNTEMDYVVLLDIKMPRVDGIEVLERMKKDPGLKKIPVIMITTTNTPQEIEICHALGCNSYIVKPINYHKLIDVVNKLGYHLEITEVP